MAIANFIPEVWSARLLSKLAKSLVFGGAPVVNRDYEGEISAYGDTVRITSIADPTITDYVKDTDLAAVEALTDSETSMLIDQAKAFNFQIDDLDKAQARDAGALMSEAANRAAFGLRDKADQFIAKKMAVGAGNALGIVDGTTPANVYDNLIVAAGVALDEADVPSEGRFLIVSPAAYGKMLLDSRFIKASESGNAALHNGQVGDAGGFVIFKSNNTLQANRVVTASSLTDAGELITGPAGTFNQGDVGLLAAGAGIDAAAYVVSVNADGSVAAVTGGKIDGNAGETVVTLSGGGKLAYAGSNVATSYAEQISKVVAYSPEARFGDALKGLHLYGAKVTRPSGLVIASVKV